MSQQNVLISVTVVVEEDGDGFHAYAPALKGLHVDGATEQEAFQSAQEAVDVYLKSLRKHNEPLPEGPGLIVHRDTPKNTVSLQHITMPWRSLSPSGIKSRTLQPAT